MAITPQAGYMIDPNNSNAVIRIPNPPTSTPTGGMNPGSLVSNQGKPGYDVFGNPVAGTPLPGGGAITSSSLSPAPSPIIPEPKPDTTNWASIIAGGNAQIQSFTTPSGVKDVPVPQTDLEKRMQTLMGQIGAAPASVESQYQSAYDTSGIEAAKKEEMAKVANVRIAQAELAGIQAQIKSVSDKRDVQNLTLEKNAAGGLVTTSFLNRQQQEVNRQAAIEALPLQALALAAQARVSALQGEAEYAQSTLKMAQDKLDNAFKLKTEDAKNLYEYQKEARTAIFNFLSDAEKARLAKIQKEDDRNFELLKDRINNAQALSKTAIENGQADIAVQITQLDPKDKEYQQKLGELQGKMTGTKNLPTSAQEYEYAKNHGYKGTYTQYQNEDANRKAIIAKAGISGLDVATVAKVQNTANQFDGEPIVKEYNTILTSLDAVKNAGITPTDDIQRIYAFAKIMDPNSVVREGEYKTVQDYSTALLERLGLKAKRVFENTGFLTQEARDFLLKTLNNRFNSTEKAYKNVYQEYGRRINKITGKDDGTSWITDYSKGFTNNFPPTGQDISKLDFSFGGSSANAPALNFPTGNIQLSNSLSGLNFKF